MQRIGIRIGIAVSILLAAPAWAQDDAAGEEKPKEKITAEKKKPKKEKSNFSLKLNGAVGGGFDSNSYNRAEKNTVAGIGDVRAGLKLGYHIIPRLSWTAGVNLGAPIRGGSQTAVKIKAGAKTGVNWLVFGMKKIPGGKKVSKKKESFPSGIIAVTGKYGFSANPVIQTFETPEEEPIDPEEEYVGDPEIDEVIEDDVEADDEDFGDDDADEDDDSGDEELADADEDAIDEEEEEEEDVDDFDDVDTVSESFGLVNPKHNFGADLKFTFNPWKKTTIGVGAVADRSVVGVDEGKPSANSSRVGGIFKVKQKIWKFGVGAQYGIDRRTFDEKTTREGDPLSFIIHKPGVFADVKIGKSLKLKLGYGYQSRLTGFEDPLDSFKHNVKLGAKLKLTSFMALMAQTSFGFQGRLDTTDKDASRFQGVVGLQFKM